LGPLAVYYGRAIDENSVRSTIFPRRNGPGRWKELSPTAVSEAGDRGAAGGDIQPAIEDIFRSIWQLTEDVLELLRSESRSAVHREKGTGLLWLDDLTETQSNTVIAVRQLCEASPEGITLKKLAETMRVTPAAASVMVDLLVKKKMLKRTKSKNDRRAVLIRLTPETAGLFTISEQNLLETFMNLRDRLGLETLLEWQKILVTSTKALRQVVEQKTPLETEALEPSPDGGGELYEPGG
jgi:DNA-binding MarR family transcriptional regulator